MGGQLQAFRIFSKAAFETLKVLYWQPDIIHCNDWQSALVPLYLKTHYRDDEFFKDVKVVLSIHNVGYQGVFDASVVPEIGANGLNSTSSILHGSMDSAIF